MKARAFLPCNGGVRPKDAPGTSLTRCGAALHRPAALCARARMNIPLHRFSYYIETERLCQRAACVFNRYAKGGRRRAARHRLSKNLPGGLEGRSPPIFNRIRRHARRIRRPCPARLPYAVSRPGAPQGREGNSAFHSKKDAAGGLFRHAKAGGAGPPAWQALFIRPVRARRLPALRPRWQTRRPASLRPR